MHGKTPDVEKASLKIYGKALLAIHSQVVLNHNNTDEMISLPQQNMC